MDTSDYILLSELNDFIFCPRSIYWHHIYGKYEKSTHEWEEQRIGTIAHAAIDKQKYSSSKHILQWIPIISHEFWIQWKIDTYNAKTGILTERKYKISKIYKWYEWQLYGQYFCMTEMGYVVTGLKLYSYSDNKSYQISLPNNQERELFQKMIQKFKTYSLKKSFVPNPKKCEKCVYRNLCDLSIF